MRHEQNDSAPGFINSLAEKITDTTRRSSCRSRRAFSAETRHYRGRRFSGSAAFFIRAFTHQRVSNTLSAAISNLSGHTLGSPRRFQDEKSHRGDMTERVIRTLLLIGEEYKARGWKWLQPRGQRNSVRLYLRHAEVQATLDRIAIIASLEGKPELNFSTWSPTENWTSDAISDEEVANAILKPRAEQISKKRGEPFRLHPFQEKAAEQGSRALLLAACAAGKTIAAWKWAEEQAGAYKIGRIIFLYPTRGAATEGFRDYVGWATEADGALVHSTSRYELEAMRGNPSEAIAEKNYDQLNEDQSRLFALGLWSRRYFSATVDQFLGFIEHSYTGLCLLPALADSAVIIDEVHSFDQRMFDCLIAFLKNFEMPVLCMTATLPPVRIQQLQDAGLKLYQASEDAELHKIESHPRYQLEPVADVKEALDQAVTNDARLGRVLAAERKLIS